ncbi:hypothetical protein FZ103_23435 [Streptomonospora sp. PA3]|uniref:hypothetical protein n=1 Tax=Streptomonospora sp. PA3 TaxID=2607326 RepID=UPI0012DF3234|nr:hypothetical protein [Streptomonospora sp. PA3]MUL44077.1 hypothetical protein [Streptomonospora sp. PA3]
MPQPWPMKALGAMTAAEVLAALDQLPYLCPEDAALEMALRGQLARVLDRQPPSAAPEPTG